MLRNVLNKQKTESDQLTFRFTLQTEIFLVILAEIQRLGTGRDPFTGVIGEFSAATAGRDDTLFDAKHLLVIQFCAVLAVGAGSFDLLSKQHN